ncbi:helix-turn-helix domain-containing protein [Rhodohalobacter sp.]|uniref:helix-turn-helix domain-containing protein n=1 Tax=Rhodohalobacter sp. TaxID=1974210 RepID=UPI002ACD2991|nr:helix-turn-helix domain-containing protein [Rhodohalobacter sp.]MDZ7755256.1 helix-turn-helix domain-containing protein [Rhodohalobacter sp.]
MPSLGKDLIKIREHLGLTIHDIQDATKIPLSTLQSIEDDSIFEESKEIQTYIRGFVRTYGRKLRLDDQLVLEALDAVEVGGYNHQLLKSYPELAPPSAKPVDKKIPEEKTEDVSTDKPKEETEDIDQTGSALQKDEHKTAKYPKKSPPPEPPNVRNINWADMGKRFSTNRNNAPVRLIGIGLIVLVVLLLTYYIFTNDFFATDEPQIVNSPPVPEETIQEDESGIPLEITDEPTQEPVIDVPTELQDTLYLMIYAATDRLEPVRVWSDLKPRIDPYWLEEGAAFNFEFNDTIRVRGQYGRMLLFLNGHRIENFRQQYFNEEENSVELTRDIFDDEERWASPVPLELPPNVAEPDSVVDRPSF